MNADEAPSAAEAREAVRREAIEDADRLLEARRTGLPAVRYMTKLVRNYRSHAALLEPFADWYLGEEYQQPVTAGSALWLVREGFAGLARIKSGRN